MGSPRVRTAAIVAVLTAIGATVAGCSHGASVPDPVVSSTLITKGPFPAVTGRFGDKPSIGYPAGTTPSTKLQRTILHLGTGPKLVTGDLVVADYVGQVWNGAVFDSTYDRGQAAVVPLGTGALLRGWNAGLVGVPVGSRVELTIPPSDGYGSKGDSAAHISGTDTLVFVIDIGRRFDNHSSAAADAVAQRVPSGLPTVSGAVTTAPTITVPTALPLPAARSTVVLARGHGPLLVQGTAAVRYASVSWDNKPISSTWDSGTATAVPVGNAADSTGALFDGLVGVPVGSRVLIVAPGPPGANQRAGTAAVVVDVLAQVTTAKQMVAGS